MLLYVCTCIWQSSSPPINCSQACEDVESANVPLHHFDETSLVLRDVGVCDGLSGVTIAPRVLIQLHAEMLCAIVIHLISYLMVRFSIRHAIILFVEYCDFCRVSRGKWVVLIYLLISPDTDFSKSAWQGEHLLLSAVPGIKSHESQAELAKVNWLNLLVLAATWLRRAINSAVAFTVSSLLGRAVVWIIPSVKEPRRVHDVDLSWPRRR